MNVFQNLIQLYNQLPTDSTYKSVAGKILENMEEVANATIYDIAALTNSSRTTIWRMVQKMGYSSFSDFHHALKRGISQYSYYNRILRTEQTKDTDTVITSCLNQTKMTRSIIEKNIKASDLNAIAKQFFNAKDIIFYFPYHIYTATSFQQNLAMTGKRTGYYCLFPEMLANAETLTKDSIVVIDTIDHAETMDMQKVFVKAKEKGAKVFRLSQSGSRYKSYTDHVLLDFPLGNDIGVCLSVTTMYFLMLSEIYRHTYID